MSFEPIAIVGQACLLPGAHSPDALWRAVVERRDLVASAPPDRWGLPHRDVRGTPTDSGDRTWSDRGGYVRDFVASSDHADLDPLVQWLLYVGREALRDAGIASSSAERGRTGAVVGNLSFPSRSMSRHAERIWLGDALADGCDLPRVDARSRFTSGLPALILARELGLTAGSFCLDAACASSLVAIKLACDRLHDRSADRMLAGAVSCADDLFIHVGFCALQAMSKTGQSRPFHREADGLVPAEGAGMVVLERLSDAERQGRRILGVIRGIGLSNDGRGKGFLAPSEHGQVRAMRQAYASSGLSPSDIDYVECHATGTPTGDANELGSMARVFADVGELPIGSLKSNMGHLITAAGVAGLIKVLAAMQHETLPPTMHVDGDDERTDALSHAAPRLKVVTHPEPWRARDGVPRRAAVSAFGFGGNNAHLIVEAHHPEAGRSTSVALPEAPRIAVVACAEREVDGEPIKLNLGRLRFPPKDLEAALPQQLLMLSVADEALAAVHELPHESTGVFIGMGCDPNVARYGARWRLSEWARRWGVFDTMWLEDAKSAFAPELEAAGVLGTMPNIVANRINSAFDLGGSSMSLSGEELSGVHALEVAWRALRRGEIDAALVGAVDMSREPVHAAALAALGVQREHADAAVALVLMREDDARARQLGVLAVLDDVRSATGDDAADESRGAHAALGLTRVLRASANGDIGCLELTSLGGGRARVTLAGGDDAPQPHPTTHHDGMPFASRWPAVTLPPLPSRELSGRQRAEPRVSAAVVMPRAPELAPITSEDRSESPTPTAPLTEPTVAPHAAELVTLASQQRAQLARHHQQFVTQQLQAHQHFLEQRARTQQALFAMMQASVALPMELPPLPPAAPTSPSSVAAATLPTAPPGDDARQDDAQRDEAPVGFVLDREQLMVHAGGAISQIFGRELSAQDGYRRQVRMPLPPLLLADRMTGIDAEIGSMGLGTIWTETDVKPDSWYLHRGRMPAGIMIESGQADLMLISYLGVDLLNKSERVYRLLGCELTYHGPLPEPGDTLRYDIHVDGHAAQGDIRLFFFHYDCHIGGQRRLSVRHGQAGFFSDEELAESAGVLWDAATAEPCASPRLDAPTHVTQRRRFDRPELEAFASGAVHACFGKGFEKTAAHSDTPTISGGRMLFLEEVTELDPEGGPWGRGYLRAVDHITPDDWFFEGHFFNDPCMPGTLMFEGCLQAMAFYMAALGFTIDRDGWRFEPVPELGYKMRCRGQVLPSSKELIYEVFIEEVVAGPEPTIYADLLCTVDGLKAFHCQRMALRLVPDWPLERILRERPDLLSAEAGAARVDGFCFDHASLLACAWGRPSSAFGPIYRVFDSHRRVARLPGPPYHFMTRVEHIDGELASMEPGQRIEVAYDIPSEAWYFDDNGVATMPFCVLLEAALQPCGWLASFVGSALSSDTDLVFRNLDGTGSLKRELTRNAGTLRTRTKIVGISASAGMIIESFEVQCLLGDEVVYEMSTVFGFFPKEALEAQVGLPVPDHEKGVLAATAEGDVIDLRARPAAYFSGSARLPSLRLLMIDRITGIWPSDGIAGLGRYRSEQDVDPSAWYFKAHFFQDPVQPGSLGIEAMIQLLQFAMLERGMHESMAAPRFEPLALGSSLTWKYRGQVTVHNQHVNCILDLTETGRDERGPYAVADASLWVDGMRIYQASGLAMRLVEAPPADEPIPQEPGEEVLDPGSDRWLLDHCPTFTVPALPMMSMVDRLAGAALAAAANGGRPKRVVAIDDVVVARWLPLPAAVRLRCETERVAHDGGSERYRCSLLAWRQAGRAELSRFEPVATATVHVASDYLAPPDAPAPLADATVAEDPYVGGSLFHGPAFRKLRSLRIGTRGASATLDPIPGAIPCGTLNQGLLDAATHAIPHDALQRWCSEIAADQVAYPYRIGGMRIYGQTPKSGDVRCEARFVGFDGGASLEPGRFPVIALTLVHGERVWAELRLTEILLPKGPLGRAAPATRRAFLRDREPIAGMSLSRHEQSTTRLSRGEVHASNWLPGTLESLYAVAPGSDLLGTIAVKEHLAASLAIHPAWVDVYGNPIERAIPGSAPITAYPVALERHDDEVCVRSAGEPQLDLTGVRAYWDEYFGIGRWPVEDLYYGLIERFVRKVHVSDPGAFAALRGRSILYLANHQVAVESLLFSIIVAALSRTPTVTLAKIEHRHTWLGKLIQHCFAYPGVRDPQVITYFDRSDPSSLANIIGELSRDMTADGKSVMVHVEGTRSLSCRTPVTKMTSAFVDMALATDSPIVPVRFVGGLPADELPTRIEFPIGMGTQDIYLGAPIHPEVFRALPYKERKHVVIEALNALAPPNATEQPNLGDPAFDAKVKTYQSVTRASHEHATLFEMLRERPEPGEAIARLLAGHDAGRLALADTPEDRWLVELARRLYGERGADILVGAPR